MTKMLLRRMGFEVIEAQSAEEALVAYERAPSRVDVLFTDVILPRMHGGALADAIRAQRPDLRVLFTSGYTDEAIAQHGVLEPGVHFLPKPYSAQTLAGKLRDVLGGAEANTPG
jgi:DNA-binding NtrC family response regulator